MKKIVIFGGMFDPPHIGHAASIDAVLINFPSDEIWVMPSGTRSDKSEKTKEEDRWEMTKIFCEDYFKDSKIPVIPKRDELDLPKPTYTWATYQELLKKYPGNDFYFLIGSSLVPFMKTDWEYGEEVFNNLKFLILLEKPDVPKNSPLQSTVIKSEVFMNVSSTIIRKRIAGGFSPLPYVFPRIAEFIKEKRLYGV